MTATVTAAPPTGVVAFLVTNGEGSTRLWETDPGGMAASWLREG